MACICDASGALALEKEAIAKQKISVEELMDMAGRAVAEEVMKLKPNGLVVVVCGKGNNGGDGFVAARYLNKHNIAVKVLTLYKENTFSRQAFKEYERLPQALIKPVEQSQTLLKKAQVIVDAIFGFSFKPPVRDYEANIINLINKQKTTVISVDVPSGLEATTGYADKGKVIEASKTICFSCIKKGLLNNKGPDYAGKIKAVNIGIRPQIINRYKVAHALDKKQAQKLLPQRRALIHKKAVGQVLVIGGSSDYTGAPVMTAQSALRSGAGFVMLAVPEVIRPIIQQKTTEVVVKGLGQKNQPMLTPNSLKPLVDLSKEFDCIALGPGLSTNSETVEMVISLLKKARKPLVLDADGLNALSERREARGETCPPASSAVGVGRRGREKLGTVPYPNEWGLSPETKLVLTPHNGELSKLTGIPVEEIEKDRFSAASKLASANVTVVLKGRYSVIAAGKEVVVNLTSNPGMASAGTGDVLTGVIASFIAQGLDFTQAAFLGTYIHGLAGDIAAKDLSEYSLIATDLIDYLPDAFKLVSREQ